MAGVSGTSAMMEPGNRPVSYTHLNVREDFAALSRAYADGVGPKFKPERKELRKPETIDAVNTMEQGQMKYLTLLRYVDSTVMEVDLNTGIYHVVYMPNRDFELLRSGSRFEDSVRAFAQGSVYPDDRGTVLGLSLIHI